MFESWGPLCLLTDLHCRLQYKDAAWCTVQNALRGDCVGNVMTCRDEAGHSCDEDCFKIALSKRFDMTVQVSQIHG